MYALVMTETFCRGRGTVRTTGCVWDRGKFSGPGRKINLEFAVIGIGNTVFDEKLHLLWLKENVGDKNRACPCLNPKGLFGGWGERWPKQSGGGVIVVR